MLVFLAHQSVWTIFNFNRILFRIRGLNWVIIKHQMPAIWESLKALWLFWKFRATSATTDPSRWALNHDYWGAHFIVDLSPGRHVPSSVKQAVFILDDGECVECGSSYNLHFYHVLPYSKGGTSYSAENVQIPCARLNLSKSTKMI